jgi:hypothetical protein
MAAASEVGTHSPNLRPRVPCPGHRRQVAKAHEDLSRKLDFTMTSALPQTGDAR